MNPDPGGQLFTDQDLDPTWTFLWPLRKLCCQIGSNLLILLNIEVFSYLFLIKVRIRIRNPNLNNRITKPDSGGQLIMDLTNPDPQNCQCATDYNLWLLHPLLISHHSHQRTPQSTHLNAPPTVTIEFRDTNKKQPYITVFHDHILSHVFCFSRFAKKIISNTLLLQIDKEYIKESTYVAGWGITKTRDIHVSNLF